MKLTALSLALAATAFSGAAYSADLRMSWWGGDGRHKATLIALEACGAKYGHWVFPEFTDWTGYYQMLSTQIARGTEPDLMQIDWPWLSLLSAGGTGFADLNDFSDTIDLSNWDAAQIEAGSMKGALNGLPVSTTGRVFIFNKTAWDKAGLALPTTWDELVAAGPVFQEKLGKNYFPFAATRLDGALITVLYGTQVTGRPLIDQATNEIAWTKEDLTNAILFFQTLVDKHVIPAWKEDASKGDVPLHKNPAWAVGRIGGTYQWDSTYFKIADPMRRGEELAVTGILGQNDQKTAGIYRKASMLFSISANSPNQEAAAEVLNCLLNEPEGILALGSTRGVPASLAGREHLLATDRIQDIQIEAQAVVLAAEGPAIHPMMEFPAVQNAMRSNLEAFIYGEIDAATAADEIIYAIQRALDDIR